MFLRGELEKPATPPPAAPSPAPGAGAGGASPAAAWGARPAAPVAAGSLKDIQRQEAAAAAGGTGGPAPPFPFHLPPPRPALRSSPLPHELISQAGTAIGGRMLHQHLFSASMCRHNSQLRLCPSHCPAAPGSAAKPSPGAPPPSAAAPGASKGTPGSAARRGTRPGSGSTAESPAHAAGGLRMSLASFMQSSPLQIQQQRSGGGSGKAQAQAPAWGGTAGVYCATEGQQLWPGRSRCLFWFSTWLTRIRRLLQPCCRAQTPDSHLCPASPSSRALASYPPAQARARPRRTTAPSA